MSLRQSSLGMETEMGKLKKAGNLVLGWMKDVYRSRRLIFDLANKDFKSRYAASYLGIVWAFVQPVVTVMIYILVFQVGFKQGMGREVPFALWLTIGIVPYLFFQEALLSATNSLIEFSYLVKKVVFKISVLPIVKVISAAYVHLFFIALAVVVYLGFGMKLHIYMIQVFYYSFAAMVLVLGLSYITSALVVFFRDLGQIVNILLQFLMWLTPIMWNIDDMEWITPAIHRVLKLNPIYYITSGYRDAFLNQVWFWEKGEWTVYFWMSAVFIAGLGTFTFKKLEKHFADVL